MVASIYFSSHVYVPCIDLNDNVTVRNHTLSIEKTALINSTLGLGRVFEVPQRIGSIIALKLVHGSTSRSTVFIVLLNRIVII